MNKQHYETAVSGGQDRKSSGSRQKRKTATGMLAALLAVVLLLSGTFAWYYTTNAINEFGGKRYPDSDRSAVLHDDFDEAGEKQENGSVIHNKDVYVENTGEHPIYVRIRLDEYMEIDGKTLLANTDKMDESTWKRHIPVDKDTPEECKEVFHDYWTWKMEGKTKYVANAVGKQGVVSKYDANAITGTEVDTLDAEVITMTEYLTYADDKKAAFIGWIYDTDGYAYWSQLLEPQTATGLLLDQVTLKKAFADGTTYYYAINVVMETVDDDDLDAWLNGTATTDGRKPEKATTNAADFLKTIAASDSEDTAALKKELSSKNVGDTVTLSGMDWLVINKTADSVEVISKDVIGEYVFEESGSYKWDGSTIRGYLTGDFKDSLSPAVQSMIKTVKKETEKAHNDSSKVETSETIYLLSKEEAEALNTSYLRCDCVDGINRSVYWLRSPGTTVKTAYRVDRTTGNIASTKGDTTIDTVRGLRPAMTLSIQ